MRTSPGATSTSAMQNRATQGKLSHSSNLSTCTLIELIMRPPTLFSNTRRLAKNFILRPLNDRRSGVPPTNYFELDWKCNQIHGLLHCVYYFR
jgi:hypothetical protein